MAIEGLVELGMTPSQAIVAATRNGAIASRRLADFGTIEPGKIADLVVLAADPLADIKQHPQGRRWSSRTAGPSIAHGCPKCECCRWRGRPPSREPDNADLIRVAALKGRLTTADSVGLSFGAADSVGRPFRAANDWRNPMKTDRRTFLKWSAAAGLAAVRRVRQRRRQHDRRGAGRILGPGADSRAASR